MRCIFHPSYRIIRRRVIWVAGQWVGVKMAVSLRPALYEAILPLLNHDEDLVVRIEAATTLKTDILEKTASGENSLVGVFWLQSCHTK